MTSCTVVLNEGDIHSDGSFISSYEPNDFPRVDYLYNVTTAFEDDDELEEDEGFILYFDFDDVRNDQFNFDQLEAGDRAVLVTVRSDYG